MTCRPFCAPFRLAAAAAAFFFLAAASLRAYDVEVVKPGDVITLRVAPFGGAAGAEATKILTADLERSGWFKIVGSGGDYAVEGSASAGSVQSKVFRSNGTPVASPSASGELRRAVHAVADAIVEKITGNKGIASARIAFISDKSGHKELYVSDYDFFNVVRLTSDNSIVVAPAFNRAGTRLAFTSYRSGYPDVYVADYPSGARRVVARYPGLNAGAAFSPDGARLALTLSKDGNPELYVMSAGGSNLQRLTRTRGGESSPSWSPDGSRIAYASDDGGRPQIYVIPSSGGRAQRVSSGGYCTEPSWSPDGKRIAYSVRSGGGFAVCAVGAEGGGAETLYANGSCEDPDWAPDSRHLIFARTSGSRTDLYLLDTTRKDAVQITRNFGNCTQPSWAGR
ncbi:MAG: PD40 domain-containing protein [Verrucomicrobiae bacterium]|nr:PD40 domain-containing protein [Verrucomicrobiae bacterium]